VADTHRYFQILYWLLRLRFLVTEQIARLLYKPGSRKFAERQLRALYDSHFIDRIAVPNKSFWGRGTNQYGAMRAVHCLDEKGASHLARQLKVPRKDIDWQPRHNRQPGNLEHTLALNDFLITAHLAATQEGWQFDILQTEREIEQSGGHDVVRDPATGRLMTVKPDSVCRLIFTPAQEGFYTSIELDRGTAAAKKIKAKVRAHAAHFTSGAYGKRHGTSSSRILFVVADVRDPIRAQPLSEEEWRERIGERCEALKRWTEEEVRDERHDLFWFAAAFDVTEHAIYRAPVWWRAGVDSKQALVAQRVPRK
jgi:hypothetical protein